MSVALPLATWLAMLLAASAAVACHRGSLADRSEGRAGPIDGSRAGVYWIVTALLGTAMAAQRPDIGLYLPIIWGLFAMPPALAGVLFASSALIRLGAPAEPIPRDVSSDEALGRWARSSPFPYALPAALSFGLSLFVVWYGYAIQHASFHP